MSAQPESNASAYHPPGYCPHCSYPTDVGTCPECGHTIGPGELERDPLSVRRRRVWRRVALAAGGLAVLIAAYGLYASAAWVRVLPTDAVLTVADWGVRSANEETTRRLAAGELSQAQLAWVLAELCTVQPPYLRDAYPRDYDLHVFARLATPAGFGRGLVLRTFEPEVRINGEVRLPSDPGSWNQSTLQGQGPGWHSLSGQSLKLEPGTHDVTLIYQAEILRGGTLVGQPLTLQADFPLTVDSRPLAEFVTLQSDDAVFAANLLAARPTVTLAANRDQLLIELDRLPAEAVAARASVRVPGGEFQRLNGVLALVPRGAVGLHRRNRDGAGRLHSISSGSSGTEIKGDLQPDIAAAIRAAGAFELRFRSDETLTHRLGFDAGLNEMLIGEVVLSGVVERPAGEPQ